MILAIIPAFNESQNIKDVVLRTKKYVDRVIVIDDGSEDNTARIAREAGAIAESMDQNMGKAKAIKQGIDTSKIYSPKIVVLIDGDGQHFPEDISEIIKPIQDGKADAVFGYRRFRDKHLFNALPGFIADAIFRSKDVLCGFKAFKFEKLMELEIPDDAGYRVELVMSEESKRKKLRVTHVPIKTNKDNSNIKWREGIKYFFEHFFGEKN